MQDYESFPPFLGGFLFRRIAKAAWKDCSILILQLLVLLTIVLRTLGENEMEVIETTGNSP